MKLMALALIALGFVVALAPEADAAYCHAGVYRSGCVSRYGATVRRHGYPDLRQSLFLARRPARLLVGVGAMAMERIFARNFKEDRGASSTPGSYDPGDPETYAALHSRADHRQRAIMRATTLAGRSRLTRRNTITGFCRRLNGDDNPYSDTTVVQDRQRDLQGVFSARRKSR